jgi:hypothetical protein
VVIVDGVDDGDAGSCFAGMMGAREKRVFCDGMENWGSGSEARIVCHAQILYQQPKQIPHHNERPTKGEAATIHWVGKRESKETYTNCRQKEKKYETGHTLQWEKGGTQLQEHHTYLYCPPPTAAMPAREEPP